LPRTQSGPDATAKVGALKNGEVLLLGADPTRYTELGRFQACGKTFSHPAYADGVLYTRDSRELVAWPLQPSRR